MFDAISRAREKDAQLCRAHSELESIRGKVATLTPREREVFARVVAGRMNKQIAGDLGTAENYKDTSQPSDGKIGDSRSSGPRSDGGEDIIVSGVDCVLEKVLPGIQVPRIRSDRPLKRQSGYLLS